MAKKQLALGRGLDAILGDVERAYSNHLSDHSERIIDLSIDAIAPNPFQPRKVFQEESIKELSESIIEHGLLQPIIVCQNDKKDYILIAGERRLRACKLAGKNSIRAIVAEIDLARLGELALIENIQRENLNPIDLAKSYQTLISEYGITHEALAQKIKKSRTQVTNTLRLLQLLPEVQQALIDGKITQGHAKMLVGLEDGDQELLFHSVEGQKLSVSDTEKMVQNFKKNKRGKGMSDSSKPLQLQKLQEILGEMDLRVKISRQSLIIDFQNENQVEFLIRKLQSSNVNSGFFC
ncbi:ParB/RepB/Spo0J family partition protein [Helicobacter mustelae]|uniref:ParB family protein n=1 Tax=Helicobacter mustelae (strain ATCC 43772 / CCUG 25715 / CIP 103759 / LMG 18044 / NCTC 12198 / R85-136P) TaxID=679897 RepID=D3UGS0_HELM1|nr:ParB/RepB/Spo0J family partition protein [Helicobacter mustelae]CBG39691.1 parB family protein [Helicobacter mustelae 12198]SQH71197.1 ParB family protein [Helicobacter mustelae]STP12324.1 ParB family protein [Helicobacter mustelae]